MNNNVALEYLETYNIEEVQSLLENALGKPQNENHRQKKRAENHRFSALIGREDKIQTRLNLSAILHLVNRQ